MALLEFRGQPSAGLFYSFYSLSGQNQNLLHMAAYSFHYSILENIFLYLTEQNMLHKTQSFQGCKSELKIGRHHWKTHLIGNPTPTAQVGLIQHL